MTALAGLDQVILSSLYNLQAACSLPMHNMHPGKQPAMALIIESLPSGLGDSEWVHGPWLWPSLALTVQ